MTYPKNSSKKKKILIICPFPQGVAAGQRLKYEQYFQHWIDNGYNIDVSSFMDLNMWHIVYSKGNHISKILGTMRGQLRRIRDVFRVKQYDLVYVFMWVTPLGTAFFEWIFRVLSKKIIFDLEDMVLVEKSNDLNPFTKLLKSASKTKYLIKYSDHIITSAPSLNDYCLTINKRKACTYISSSVDTNNFTPTNTYSNDRKITIGWTGTFTSKIYLDLLRGAFLKLKKERDFRLIVIGNFEYDFPELDLEVIRWTKENEIADLQKIDIGVYPLPIDDWVGGKSGLKAIQYMAFGLPTVATNVGTTPRIIKHKHNGWLVESEEEWIEGLKALIDNPNLRRQLGENARQTVIERYSINAIKKNYLDILNQLVYGSES
jgi:L-malate glycosyltransferase